MDYDATDIAAVYDKARAVTPETLRQWREFLATHLDPETISLIVDLGCGTGRFSRHLADHFAAFVVAIDPSQKMLDQARQKLASGQVAVQRAAAEALPLVDCCADLVFMSMVYHHFADPRLVARECHRVLRRGGHVCVRNGSRESDFPHRHFFPALDSLIASELPCRADIVAGFTGAGFRLATREVIVQKIAPDWTAFAENSALRADSFLARLPESDFASGMAALRTYANNRDPNEPVTEEIDWFLFRKD